MVDVTFIVPPLGLGPFGKALPIAQEFLKRGYTVRFLGDKLVQELLQPLSIPFAAYEFGKPLDTRSLQTKIVISCGDTTTPIIKHGTPLILIDSLLWMRGRWEVLVSTNADLYIAQRFLIAPLKKVSDSLKGRLHFVDAILPTWAISEYSLNKEGTVVFPGGMRSPLFQTKYYENYLSWIAAVLEMTGAKDKSIRIIIPPHLVNTRATDKLAKLASITVASSTAMQRLLPTAKQLITARSCS